jgi:Domain of unknown function (DUF4189)
MMVTQTQPAAPDGDDPTAIVADDKAVNSVESRAIISEFFRPGGKDYAPDDFIQAVRVEAREAWMKSSAGLAPDPDPDPDPETKLAQTAAAPHGEPPTAVVANKAPTVAALAWSEDADDGDDPLDDDRSTTFWLRLYVGTTTAVVLALGVMLWFVLSNHREPVAAVAVPASTAPVAVLPSSPAAAAPVPMPSAPPAPTAPPVAASPEPIWGASPPTAAAPTQDDDDNQFVAIAVSVATRRGGYGMAGTVDEARTIALNECKSATGDELCTVAESAHYGCVAYALDAARGFAGGKGPDPDSARQFALAQLPGANYVSVAECSK